MSRTNVLNDIHLRVTEPTKNNNETSENISIDSDTKKIIEGYEIQIKNDPYNCDLLLEFSQFLVKESFYSKAISILLRIINIDNNNKECLRLLFYSYDHENKFHHELKIEEKLKKIDVNNHRMFYWLSEFSFENGRVHEAIKYIKKSIKIDEKNRDYWKFLAQLQSTIGNEKGVFEAWNEVLKIDPENDIAKLNLAIAKSTNGQHEQADKLFSTINTENSQSDLELDLFISYYLWNCIKLDLPNEDIEKIIQKYDLNAETIINIHNNDIITVVYEYLGDYFAKKNKFNKSIEIFKKAYEISPNEELKIKITKNYIDLSKKCISNRHVNEAIEYLKDGLSLDPENETINEIYNELKGKQGRQRLIITSAIVAAIILTFGLIIIYYCYH